MGVTSTHDTLSYVRSDGTVAEAEGVVLLGGSIGTANIGSPSDAPWDGVSGSASLIAIMKACHARLVEIAANTGA